MISLESGGPDGGHGKRYVAAREIAPGEAVLAEVAPLVLVPHLMAPEAGVGSSTAWRADRKVCAGCARVVFKRGTYGSERAGSARRTGCLLTDTATTTTTCSRCGTVWCATCARVNQRDAGAEVLSGGADEAAESPTSSPSLPPHAFTKDVAFRCCETCDLRAAVSAFATETTIDPLWARHLLLVALTLEKVRATGSDLSESPLETARLAPLDLITNYEQVVCGDGRVVVADTTKLMLREMKQLYALFIAHHSNAAAVEPGSLFTSPSPTIPRASQLLLTLTCLALRFNLFTVFREVRCRHQHQAPDEPAARDWRNGDDISAAAAAAAATADVSVVATATALYLEASYFDHSCDPNIARRTYDDSACASFVALRRIETGESLCISYISTDCSFAARQAALRASYGFHCSCARCCWDARVRRMRGRKRRPDDGQGRPLALSSPPRRCRRCVWRGYLISTGTDFQCVQCGMGEDSASRRHRGPPPERRCYLSTTFQAS